MSAPSFLLPDILSGGLTRFLVSLQALTFFKKRFIAAIMEVINTSHGHFNVRHNYTVWKKVGGHLTHVCAC